MKDLFQISNIFCVNFKNGLRNKKIWIILLLANVFALPYGLLSILLFDGSNELVFVITGFSMVVNMLLGMIIPLNQFDYCYTKTKVDMVYALPLSRREQFLSDFFSGLCMYLCGYLVQIILSYSMIVLYILNGCQTRNTKYYVSSYFNMQSIGWIVSNVSRILIVVLLIQIMLYTVTSFVIACTGAIFEAITATIYFNILLPSTVLVFYLMCNEQVFGMDFSNYALEFIYRTSPLGGFVYLVTRMYESYSIASWALPYCITIVLFFIATYWIMIKRSAQSVGKTFVIRAFYHVVVFAIILHIGILALFVSSSIITYIVLTLIFYFIFEMITNRGFKKVKQSVIRYVATTLSVLVVIVVINKTDCFGVAYRVVNANEVKYIDLGYTGIFDADYEQMQIRFKSKENIKRILDVQRHIINEYKSQRQDQENRSLFSLNRIYDDSYWKSYCGEFRIAVQTKNHKTYNRNYHLTKEMQLELAALELSEEYIDARIEQYKQRHVSLEICDQYGINRKTIVKDVANGESAIGEEFFRALKQDLLNTNLDEYLSPKDPIKYQCIIGSYQIPLHNSYTNCMEFLKKYNVNFKLGKEDYKNLVDMESVVTLVDPMIEEGYYRYIYQVSHSEELMVRVYDRDVQELLENACMAGIIKEGNYYIGVNGQLFCVSKEYKEVMDRIIAKAEKQSYIAVE